MYRLLVTGVTAMVLAGVGTSALAAKKKQQKADPPAVAAPAVNDWTGFYLGGNAGDASGGVNTLSFFTNTTTPNANSLLYTAVASPSLHSGTFTGGLQAGYNAQYGQAVFGLEVDGEAVHLHNSQGPSTFPNIIGGSTITVSSAFSTNWLITVRPRLGYAANNFLVYVTGGGAFVEEHYNANYSDSAGEFAFSTIAKTQAGWSAGGGIEYALYRNWLVRAEYLHAGFNSQSVNTPIGAGVGLGIGTVFTHNVSNLNIDIVRGGLSYKF